MLEEFREFAVRGSVVDMAVGILIGAAFGRIVTSLVEDIIMPPIGLITGKIDFSNLYVNLSKGTYQSLSEAKAAGAATINYGIFINHFISFLVVAFCVFFLVKQINNLKRKEDAASIAPTQKSCPYCFSSISIKATKCAYCTAEFSKD
ncbi:MAG: large conductance mechanosensitive channel protein MscL [Candidatus Omnitrophica bacterium]|nr:large conductance mechanosensitive channel protein MscL [Candidatus Omnitrophota bacterium]MCF7892094.1 large conductance mechanosensitive channel protein MscL [Candidatus Omnitrophota bacterium]MCF7895925.1 large conductance mechanosensitive channel protein MscL [Candidatus Omnitrophota bacterium]MCF7908975.1 large conductance mechanosensitive channel protein MscL [Candidatus Omnitrophota bacterium]